MKKITLWGIAVLLLALVAQASQWTPSGDGADGWTTTEQLSAAELNELKTAVNDTDTRLTTAESDITTNAADVATRLPNAAADNAVIRSDGTAGNTQDSGVLIDDSDNLTVPGTTTSTGTLIASGAATVATTLDVTGTITGKTRVTSYATTDTLLSGTDAQCSVITNDGATGTVNLDLPEAEAGLCVTFFNIAGEIIQVDPQGDKSCVAGPLCDIIIGDAANNGSYIALSATIGAKYTVVGFDSNTWMPVGTVGAITEEP